LRGARTEPRDAPTEPRPAGTESRQAAVRANRVLEPTRMAPETIRRRVIVHGRVQGVFFRDSLREHAHAHGVSGWVANRSDGKVEAVLEGSPDAVERVIGFSEAGPPRADVERVEVLDERPEGMNGFEVR
jgi:acylphosphatase